MTTNHELLRRESRRGQVLRILMEARENGQVTLDDTTTYQTPDGWLPGYVLDRADVGGQNGTRRVRELRAAGHQIEAVPMSGRDAWKYRWTGVNDPRAVRQVEVPDGTKCGKCSSGAVRMVARDGMRIGTCSKHHAYYESLGFKDS